MKRALGGVVGAAGIIAILTLLSRIAGLLRKLAQSWAMSDGAVASAYDTANTVPNVLFEVAAGGALAGAVIPLMSKFLARGDKEKLDQTASALISWLLLIGLPISLLVAIFSHQIVGLLFGSDSAPQIVNLASVLLAMFALQIPFYGLSVVFTGILQAHKRFILPALSPLLSSVVVIAVFLSYAKTVGFGTEPSELPWRSILLLGWGTTAGVLIFSLPQLIPVLKLVRLRFTLNFPPGVARHTMRLAGAGFGALVAQQIAIIAIMYTSNSQGNVGTYNAFNYAFSIFMVPYAVLAVPVATAVFPRISAAVENASITKQNRDALESLVSTSTRLVVALGMVAAVLLAVLAEPAKIVIDLGRDIEGLEVAMTAMSGALVGYSVLYHGARVLYGLDAGKRVITVNSLAWGTVCVVLLSGIVTDIHGRVPTLILIGAALTAGMCVGALLIVLAIRAELGPGATEHLMRTVLLLLTILAPVAIVTKLLTDWLLKIGGYSIASAFGTAVVVGVIVLAGGLAAIFLADRRALLSLRK
ncbi:murein biosynthesis integral membrane protein MurJ [Arcanobacterium bovis]|uniref:Virulence factor MviN n=1 Tax=Arcanobacterium bovis TaxID=2529275 RepID=A0A4Q9V1T2_9ACTO|nr:lipid II flippase MurJ [Arcanobacterium bovis]TBW23013.1 virulence factor MviN [Arcanobacterium bovis]